MSKLPDSLPDLIELAVADARRVVKDKRYRLDMFDWHWYNEDFDRRCHVCLAGAVMAKTLGTDPKETCTPDNSEDGNRLRALDAIRSGRIPSAYGCLGRVPPLGWVSVFNLIEESYSTERGRAPWPVYLKAARMLRELEAKQ